MAKFLGRALDYLDSVFQFTGSQVATDSLDLTGAQLVADVTRLAATGGPGKIGASGFGWYVLRNDHTAANTVENSVNLRNPNLGVGNWPNTVDEDTDLWIIAASAQIGLIPTEVSDVQITVDIPIGTQVGGTPSAFMRHLIGFWTDLGLQPTTPAASDPTPFRENRDPVRYPIIVPPIGDPTLIMRSVSTGAGNPIVFGNVLVAAVARGVKPF